MYQVWLKFLASVQFAFDSSNAAGDANVLRLGYRSGPSFATRCGRQRAESTFYGGDRRLNRGRELRRPWRGNALKAAVT
jgi:hypothetical protein